MLRKAYLRTCSFSSQTTAVAATAATAVTVTESAAPTQLATAQGVLQPLLAAQVHRLLARRGESCTRHPPPSPPSTLHPLPSTLRRAPRLECHMQPLCSAAPCLAQSCEIGAEVQCECGGCCHHELPTLPPSPPPNPRLGTPGQRASPGALRSERAARPHLGSQVASPAWVAIPLSLALLVAAQHLRRVADGESTVPHVALL